MKIQCENCAIQHELDPPSWVVSSGRAFRFRCSSCGHSQSVQPVYAAEESGGEPVPSHELNRPSPTLAPPEEEAPPELAKASDAAVFLKQNGQIYMVRDWDTLKRWIEERRVDKHDLVSEGGVRWEPIGSRADLLPHFQEPPAHPPVAPSASTPFPFGGDTPFGQVSTDASAVWHDDDTEGIPTGLPPLPTEEVFSTTSRTILPIEEPAPPALLEDVMDTPDPPDVPGWDPGPADPPSEPPAAPFTPPGNAPTAPEIARPRIARPTPAIASGDWDDFGVDTDETAAPEPELEPTPWETSYRPGNQNHLLYAGLAAATLVFGLTALWWYIGQEPLEQPVGGLGVRVEQTAKAEPVSPAPAPEPAPEQPMGGLGVRVEQTAKVEPVRPAPAPEPAPKPPEPAPVTPAPTAAAAPKPPPAPAPEPPSRATPPAPAPKPAAAPAPKPAAQPSVASLIEQGWSAAEDNPATARQHFERALAASPRNNEAQYGYGYVLLKLGQAEAAQPHLCQALVGAPIDIQREVNGLLDRHGLACN